MNSTNKTDNFLQDFDLGEFLTQNKHLDGETFLLRDKGSTNFIKGLLASQLNLYPKVKHKLPTFHRHHCWVTPKSFEQCSSEMSALFKSSLFYGNTMLDLSGGLGVDDWAFSTRFNKVISLDPNHELNQLVRVNNVKLGVTHIDRLDLSAEEFLLHHPTEHFDLIFLDADRRNPSGKDYSLEGGLPSYPNLANALHKMANNILLKLSPMIDLSYLKQSVEFLEKIIIVGDKHEVKEILAVIKPGYMGNISTEAYVLGQPENITKWPDLIEQIEETQESGLYLLEAHNVLVKAGLALNYLQSRKVSVWGKSGAFGFFRFEPKDWMGRVFKVVTHQTFQKATFKQYLKTHKITKANLTKRSFPASVEELRKTFQIKEGGDDYFFFTTLSNDALAFCHAVKCN